MNRADMAEKLAAKLNITHLQAAGIINIFTNSIMEALSKGDKMVGVDRGLAVRVAACCVI